ncbi:crotonase/enoyl-CoA hydratase family protein [Pleionea sp. CnH1-48]|uniref:crotonase/enoyl-CoA hydratase family protein n=1 Tax=Pleionea sp. CnH1-48 TaxID=2954494 RepID=UPI00209817AD|nr:crotonase/enoyl-CoA hydratase family protein [Pleionea sp. CnH1-48]MCO7223106.1 crotonase/enoyl-CoA hydratase family protein [Pleionea sp. CnH1-48]
MSESRVSITINNGFAEVQLNRPDKRNALDMAMFYDLDKVIRKISKDKSIRAVIVSGAGDDFCSGLDIKSVMTKPVNGIKLLWKWLPGNANLAQRVVVGWRRLPVPVIMAIHGRCWGGGTQIALGGDFRIASPEANLSIMEGRWGLIPDMGGTLTLKEILSVDQAMEWAMSAEEISAESALEHGLLNQVADDPLAAARALAEKLTIGSPDAVAGVKKLYHRAWHRDQRAVLARETFYQWRILLGKNRSIAVKKQLSDPTISFAKRKSW